MKTQIKISVVIYLIFTLLAVVPINSKSALTLTTNHGDGSTLRNPLIFTNAPYSVTLTILITAGPNELVKTVTSFEKYYFSLELFVYQNVNLHQYLTYSLYLKDSTLFSKIIESGNSLGNKISVLSDGSQKFTTSYSFSLPERYFYAFQIVYVDLTGTRYGSDYLVNPNCFAFFSGGALAPLHRSLGSAWAIFSIPVVLVLLLISSVIFVNFLVKKYKLQIGFSIYKPVVTTKIKRFIKWLKLK